MEEGMYVKNAAGEWVNIGKLVSGDMYLVGKAHTRQGSEFASLDWRTSTYVRPSDDELRNRIRREFGV